MLGLVLVSTMMLVGLIVSTGISLGSLVIGAAALLLSIPSTILAWHSIQTRREAIRTAAAAAAAAEAAKEKAAELKTIADLVLQQVKPRNGKTVAQTAESTSDEVRQLRHDFAALAVAFGDHLRTHDGKG